MPNYEIVREIFNQCSGNQMRDVAISETYFDNEEQIDEYMNRFRTGKVIEEKRTVLEDDTIVYDLVTDELKQRITFDRA